MISERWTHVGALRSGSVLTGGSESLRSAHTILGLVDSWFRPVADVLMVDQMSSLARIGSQPSGESLNASQRTKYKPIGVFTQASREHGLDCDSEVGGAGGFDRKNARHIREAAQGAGVVRSIVRAE